MVIIIIIMTIIIIIISTLVFEKNVWIKSGIFAGRRCYQAIGISSTVRVLFKCARYFMQLHNVSD